MTRVAGIRGATTVQSDNPEEVVDATQELLEVLSELNGFDPDDLASIFFTVTPDITSTFPARAARRLGWTQVPMMCSREIAAPASVDHCVRVLMHWNTDKGPADIHHVYLRNARLLRPDWAHGAEQAAAERAATAPEAPAVAAPAWRPSEPADVTAVAFQGEPGAYSQEALFRWLGAEVDCVPAPTFDEAFQAVTSGRAATALLPVENSTTGSIHQVYDLLLKHPLQIQAEVILPVRHVLMARSGTPLTEIKRVLSHPQALDQCSRWIASHGWEPVPVHDTAGAARLVSEDDALAPDAAAIASRVSAGLYGLNILAQDIQDVARNYTRFLLLAPEPVPGPKPVKTSVIFATRHVAGDLYACLAQFAVREINLTKIESRPDRNTPWNYLFYLDFEGVVGDPRVEQALAGLHKHVTFVRVLGSYPSTELR